MASVYKTIDGDRLDQICHRHYGTLDGSVEVVLDANAGLAEKPIILTAGIDIVLPDFKPKPTQPLRLWE